MQQHEHEPTTRELCRHASRCLKGGMMLSISISGKYISLYKASATYAGCLMTGGDSLGNLSHSRMRSFHQSIASLVDVTLPV